MQEIFYAAVVALLTVLALGPVIIPVLRRLKFGQSIREDGPKRHLTKAGTPTMGGLLDSGSFGVSLRSFLPGGVQRYGWYYLLLSATD